MPNEATRSLRELPLTLPGGLIISQINFLDERRLLCRFCRLPPALHCVCECKRFLYLFIHDKGGIKMNA